MIKIRANVTRIEVISEDGREYVNVNCKVDGFSYQDNNKTLKIFINKKIKERIK